MMGSSEGSDVRERFCQNLSSSITMGPLHKPFTHGAHHHNILQGAFIYFY